MVRWLGSLMRDMKSVGTLGEWLAVAVVGLLALCSAAAVALAALVWWSV